MMPTKRRPAPHTAKPAVNRMFCMVPLRRNVVEMLFRLDTNGLQDTKDTLAFGRFEDEHILLNEVDVEER